MCRASELGFLQRNEAPVTGVMYLCVPAIVSSVAAVHFWEGKSRDLIVTPDLNPLALCGKGEELWGLTPMDSAKRHDRKAKTLLPT